MATEQPLRKRSRGLPFFVFLVCGCAAAALLIAAWIPRHREEKELYEQAKRQAEALPRVQVQHVERAKSASQLLVPGTTLPYAEAYIYARASGYISRRLVDIGDHVRAGQLLATIDAPDLDRQVAQARSALAQSRATLLQMQAQLRLASANWERYKVLVAKGVFSRQEGDQQEANFRVAEANVRAAENMVEGNRQNLNRLLVLQGYEQVQAPFTGIITARNVDVGTLITANGAGLGSSSVGGPAGLTELAAQGNNQGASGNVGSNASPATGGAQGGQMFSVAAVDRLRVLVSVPEVYTPDIHPGQQALLRFPTLTAQTIEGRVTRTSSAVDQSTRTLLVEVQVVNRFHLVPGMFVMVSFVDVRRTPPIVIPGAAIVVRGGKPAVALIQDGTVHFQPISIGRDYGDQSEVSAGLQPGDVIATSVSDEIQEGVRVEPQFPKAAPQQGGGARQGEEHSMQRQYGNQALSDKLDRNNRPNQNGKHSNSQNVLEQ